MNKRFTFTLLAILLFMGASPVVFADTPDGVLSALEGLKQQMAKMQQTIDEQNFRIQQLESRKVLEPPQPSVPVQPAPATMSEADWQKGIKENIGEAIPWLKGAKYGGGF